MKKVILLLIVVALFLFTVVMGWYLSRKLDISAVLGYLDVGISID